MKALPNLVGKLEGPLSLYPPALVWLFWLLVAGLVLWLLVRHVFPWLASKKKAREAWLARNPLPAKVDFDGELATLRAKIKKSRRYRDGLFELNARVKAWLTRRTGIPFEELSADEIERLPSQLRAAKFFRNCERTACAKEDPGPQAFANLVNDAQALGANGKSRVAGDEA